MGDYAARRGSARLPIAAPVSIRFPGVDEEFEGTVGDIGMSGMYVAGSAPMPPGTLMHFEFRPSPQWHMLAGRGRIVWARPERGSEGQPAGMGVRFIELDERGRIGVRWLIETYQSVGDKPFDTWSVPSQFTRGTASTGDVLATQEIEPIPPVEEETSLRKRKAWPLLAAGLALVVLASGWAFLSGDDNSNEREPTQVAMNDAVTADDSTDEIIPSEQETRTASAEESSAQAESSLDAEQSSAGQSNAGSTGAAEPPAPPVTAAASGSTPDSSPAATSQGAGSPAAESGSATVSTVLTELVGEWAAAWSSQNLDRYLAFYAPEFQPDSGVSRSAWARQRRDRLARPQFIRVAIDGVQVLDPESSMPRTVFTQSYESDTFSDQVTKSVTWTRSEGTWRIVTERSAP